MTPEDEDPIDWLEERASWQEVAKLRIEAEYRAREDRGLQRRLQGLKKIPSPWGQAPTPTQYKPPKLMTKKERRQKEALKAYKPKEDMIDYLLELKVGRSDDPY